MRCQFEAEVAFGGRRVYELIPIQTDQSVYRASPLVRSSSGPVETDLDANIPTYKHEGSFAVGQALVEHHPERLGEKGDFASGVELQRDSHQGTFAEGQEQADPHPELLEKQRRFRSRRDLRPLMVVRCVRYPRAHRISRTPASHQIMSVVVVLSPPLQTMACAIRSIAVRPSGKPGRCRCGRRGRVPIGGLPV